MNRIIPVGIGIAAVIVIIASIIMLAAPQNVQATIIPWDEDRPLSWDDFEGEPDEGSEYHANTGYGIDFDYEYGVGENEDGCYIVFRINATAYFNKTSSWVKGERGEDLLKHEQKHFDIAEIYKRKLIEKFEEEYEDKQFPCPESEGGGAPTEEEMNAEAERIMSELFNEIMDEMEQKQDEYDRETDHGQNPQEQQEWCDWVEEQLSEDDDSGG